MWELFFDDGARFDIINAYKELGDRVTEETAWSNDVTEKKGLTVLKHKTYKARSKLPDNPVSKFIKLKKDQYLLTKDSTRLEIWDVNSGSGFHDADSSISNVRWEVYQPEKDRAQTVMRCSWKFHWVDKPWIGASTVKSVTTKKVTETTRYIWHTHLPNSVQAYSENP